jgi:phage terminase Nu1 subunit (DNA packaging protein)
MPKFLKVIPLEYQRALHEMKLKEIDEQLKNIRDQEQLEVHA